MTSVALAALLTLVTRSPRIEPQRVAHDDAAEARARVQRTWAEVDEGFARLDIGLALIDAKIAMALDEHTGCPSPRDREAALAKLREIKRQRDEALRRLAELRRQMRREDGTICRLPRRKVQRVIIDTACIENPLARGCM